MNSLEGIEGFWRVVGYEQDGVPRPARDCRDRAHLVLSRETVVAGSDGIWGEIRYRSPPTPETASRSLRALRRLIQGREYERSEDYHLYSGGIVDLGISEGGIVAVDFLVYHGPDLYAIEPEHSVSRGILRHEGIRLTVCLADASTKTRPSEFGSTGTPHQSLTVYVREENLDVIADEEPAGDRLPHPGTPSPLSVAGPTTPV